MPKIRDSYGNSPTSGYTIDFFSLNAPGSRNAFLASPFVSTFEPLKLLTDRNCEVRIIVRLCSITPPSILQYALENPLISMRYYTSRKFHAKLYIIDDKALVGSANLTESGLKTNREVSVVLQKERDPGFDELPALFALFWEYADVVTSEVYKLYVEAYKHIKHSKEDLEFQNTLEKYVSKVEPPSAAVGSEKISAKRSFLQNLRRKYDEKIIPAFREVQGVFNDYGKRRSEYAHGDMEVELSRFLGWARLIHAPGDKWKQVPLADISERNARIRVLLADWHTTSSTSAGDMIYADQEVGNIQRIRNRFSSIEEINILSYDEIFETLIGCHAFNEMQRFVSGGLSGLKTDFLERNSLSSIRTTLSYLLHGAGSSLERAYDCIYNEKYKLGRFGEACIMELIGWTDENRPPVNGRTIKALRFIGFNVSE